MLPVILIVTRTMTTTATAVMDTDQAMDTDHMPPRLDMGLDHIHTGHMRVHTAPGGGDTISGSVQQVEPTKFKKWDLRAVG